MAAVFSHEGGLVIATGAVGLANNIGDSLATAAEVRYQARFWHLASAAEPWDS